MENQEFCLDVLRSGNQTDNWVQDSGTQDQVSVVLFISTGGATVSLPAPPLQIRVAGELLAAIPLT